MSEYSINVNFTKGVIDSDLNRLVQNDYNTTKLKFKFDDEENRVVFKMLYPDGETSYITEITDNELIFGPGILSQSGTYEVEISLYTEDGRLTSYATMEFYVRNELFDSDEPVSPDDRVPILDQLITDVNGLIDEVDNIDVSVSKEDDVATVMVTKKDGTSQSVEIYDGIEGPQGPQGVQGKPFTIDKTYSSIEEMQADLNNVEVGTYAMIASSVESEDNAKLYYRDTNDWIFISDFSGATGIQGEQGPQGPAGRDGRDGVTPIKGVDYFTPEDIAEIEGDIEEITGDLSNLSTADKTSLVNAINEVVTNTGDLSIQELETGVYNIENLDAGVYIPKGGTTVRLNLPRRSDGHDQGDVYVQYTLDGILIKGSTPSAEIIEDATYDIGYYVFSTADVKNNYVLCLINGYYENIVYSEYPEYSMLMGDYQTTYNSAKEYTDSVAGDLANLSTSDKTTLVNAINEAFAKTSEAQVYNEETFNISTQPTGNYVLGSSVQHVSYPGVASVTTGWGGSVVSQVNIDERNAYAIILTSSNDIRVIGKINNTSKNVEGTMLLNGAQNIRGEKTFVTIPKLHQNLVITDDQHIVNKKYVDDITGSLSDLDTTDTTSLVNAINEVASSSSGSIDTYAPYISNGSYSTYYLNLGNTLVQNTIKNMINSALPEDKTLITSSINYFIPTKRVWFTEGPLVHHLEISNYTTYYRVVIALEPTTLNQTAGTYLRYYRWFPYPTYTVYCSIDNDGEVAGVYSEQTLTSQGSVRISLGPQALIVNSNYSYDVLTTSNTSSYTPTGDYNPATKKYVDDAVASAGGGSDVPIYILNTTNQMTDNNGSFNLSNDEKADYSAIITDAYAKGYKHIAIMLCSTTSGKSYMFYSNSVITNTTSPTFYADATFNDRTNMDYIVRRSLSGFGTWNNDEFTVTGLLNCDVERRLIVHQLNSVAYMVSNDYQPAHKKYVDDSIAAAITTTLGGSY